MTKPIKRHKVLKPLSREHHYGLLLCWKIKQGFKKDVEPERMKAYSDWFQLNYLNAHFDAEEKYIFPILGTDHVLVKRALEEHQRLQQLFNEENDIEKALDLITNELDLHIKFEERILFNEIQNSASSEQLEIVEKHHHEVTFNDEDWKDHFWLS